MSLPQAWKRASLRTQLVAISVLLLSVSLAVLALVATFLLRSFQADQLNSQLQIAASTIRQTGYSAGPINNGRDRLYSRVVNSDGTIVEQRDTKEGSPYFPPTPLEQVISQNGRIFDVPDQGSGATWRATIIAPVTITRPSSVQEPGYILVAISYDEFNDSISRLGLSMFSVSLLTVAIGTMIAHWSITRSFKPLHRVEKTAAMIAQGDMSQRVEVTNPSTEVGRLSMSLNTMLTYIEHAFAARKASEERMRQFIADASHELRTPLVTIRGFSELYRHGGLPECSDVDTSMARIEAEAQRMGALIEDLLVLAHLAEDRVEPSTPVDLLVLSNDAVVDARATVPDRDVALTGVDGGSPAHAPVLGYEARLRQVVANLMSNALRYTPAGSPIEIGVGVETIDDEMFSVIYVRDHGPGIELADTEKIFERFYRSDSSRHRDKGGFGLGLAIVAAIVEAHEGTVAVTKTPGGGATMTIRLPYHGGDEDGGDEGVEETGSGNDDTEDEGAGV